MSAMNVSRFDRTTREEAMASDYPGRPTRFQRAVLWLTLFTFIAQPIAVSAQVIAAATGAYRPQVGSAQNGVPVVQITAPSAAGVSRNQYQQFDVSAQGVVLNNSPVVVSTQQAGYIEGNANLGGGPARIILNEVTSNLPSNLSGYTEVAGSKADVVIANPNGITCNGCGFINTSRGILTTGTPVFGGNGSLDAFRVTGGNVTINGSGLDGNGADEVDLIARAVQANAGIWGKTLNVVTGANQVNYADLSTQAVAGSGAAPSVSIDVALLGGMYANKIHLVGTEAGVGVANAGTLATQAGELTIDSAGDVTLTGSTRSAGALSVNGGANVTNTGTVYAQGDATLSASSQFTNSGTVAAAGNATLTAHTLDNSGVMGAGIDSGGNVGSGTGNLVLTTDQALTTSGSLIAGNRLALSGAALNLAGSFNQATSISYTALAGDIDHRSAQTQAFADATLSATGTLDNSGAGQIEAGTTLNVNAGTIDNAGGGIGAGETLDLTAATVANQSGTLYSAQDASLTADSYTGDGVLLADRDLTIQLNSSYTQSASNTIQANRNLNFTLTGDLVNQGTLSAVGNLALSAANIDNQSGATLQGDSATLTATQSFNNTGTVLANTLALQADSFTNTASVYGQDVTVNANSLSNSGSGVIAAGNTLNLYVTGTLSNLDGGLLYSAGDLAIAADAHRDINNWLDDPTDHVLNRSADIEAGRDLEITATTLDNLRTSIVTSTQTLSSTTTLAQELDGSWSSSLIGTIYNNTYGPSYWGPTGGGEPTFTMRNDSDRVSYERRRVIVSSQMQEVVASATAEARMMAGRDIYLRAGTVNNTASRIEAANNLLAQVTTLNNTGYDLSNKTQETVWHGGCSDIKNDEAGMLGTCASGWLWTTSVSDTITGTNATLDSLFSGAQTLSLNATTVNNSTVNAQGLPPGGVNLTVGSTAYHSAPYAFTAPAGGLYTVDPSPTAHYLVETDPRFTQFSNFISSDYMLSRLDLDPETTEKRLGDGYYEQQLVRNQLINRRGTASLGQYASLDAEYQSLLDAGIAYAQAFEIAPGVTLTQDQIAHLDHDMVWLEERVVDGQKLLVPVVYFAAVDDGGRVTGALIGGGANATISAYDINNRGTIAASGQVTLKAAHDINNDSGHIAGGSVDVAAGNDLHVGVATQSVTLSPGQIFTREGLAGSVEGRNVSLAAGRDLTLAGGRIDAGDATLSAGRDLTIGSQALNTEQHARNGDSRYDRSITTQRASQVVTSGNLNLAANNDLTISGSAVSSGGDLTGSAGNNLLLSAAKNTETVDDDEHSKQVDATGHYEKVQSQTSTVTSNGNLSLSAGATLASEGATLRATNDVALTGDNIVLDAAHDTAQHREQYSSISKRSQKMAQGQEQSDTATGSIVDAGRNLNVTSNGDTTVVGGALAAGQDLALHTGGDFNLLAAQSTHSADLSRFSQNSRKATKLAYSEQDVRQLLSTITVGNHADLQVGGNFAADTGETQADGTLNADRMTTAGVVKGDSRQQVSVTRTGDDAQANPTASQVQGDLAAQGIRNGSNDSFDTKAADNGSAALQKYLASGLLQIKGSPEVASHLQAVLQNNDGGPLTVQDPSGKVSLTVAGQARVQEVFNTLKLTETFDVKKFPDQQTAQIVTLVAAVVLTICTGGTGAGTLGAAIAGTGAQAATIAAINAGIIGMSSTMLGQLAGGSSFGDAFQAGIKAGVTSAVLAGLAVKIDSFVNSGNAANATTASQAAPTTIDSGGQVVQFGGNTAKTAVASRLDILTSAKYWEETGLNALAKGVVSQAEGGKFEDAAIGSVVGSLSATGANLIGGYTSDLPLTNIIAHAVLGCATAAASNKDCQSGAVGGAASATLAQIMDKAIGNDNGPNSKTQNAVIAGTSVLGSMAIAAASGKDVITAGNAAANEVLNNSLSHHQATRLTENIKACAGNVQCINDTVRNAIVLSNSQGNTIDQANAQSAIPVLAQLAGDPSVPLTAENRAAIATLAGKNELDYVDWSSAPNPDGASNNPTFSYGNNRYASMAADGSTFTLPLADCPAAGCTNGDSIAWATTNQADQQTLAAYQAALDRQALKTGSTAAITAATLALAPVTLGGSVVTGGVINGGTSLADQYIDTGNVDVGKTLVDAGKGSVLGIAGYGGGIVIGKGLDAFVDNFLLTAAPSEANVVAQVGAGVNGGAGNAMSASEIQSGGLAAKGGVRANKAAGDAFEQQVMGQLQEVQSGVVQQVTVKTQSGVKTRIDLMGRDASGNIVCTECKASATAPLTKNQAAAFPEIQQTGAVVVGKGKPGFPGGTQIPPTTVTITRP